MPTSSGFGLNNYVTTINWASRKATNNKNKHNKSKTEGKVRNENIIKKNNNVKVNEISQITEDGNYTHSSDINAENSEDWTNKNDSDLNASKSQGNSKHDDDYAYTTIFRNKNDEIKPQVEQKVTRGSRKMMKIYTPRQIKSEVTKKKSFTAGTNTQSLVSTVNPNFNSKNRAVLEIQPFKKDYVEIVEEKELSSMSSIEKLQPINEKLEKEPLESMKKLKKEELEPINIIDDSKYYSNSEDSIAFADSSFLTEGENSKGNLIQANNFKKKSKYKGVNKSFSDDQSYKSNSSYENLALSNTNQRQSQKYNKNHKSHRRRKNKKKHKKESSSEESSSSLYIVDDEDDHLKIDRKGDLNFYIQPQKTKENKSNSDVNDAELRNIINKIMKNKKNNAPNKETTNEKLRRKIKTEDAGGDKGYTIYLDKSGTGGGLNELIDANLLKKTNQSFNRKKNNDPGNDSLDGYHENQYNHDDSYNYYNSSGFNNLNENSKNKNFDEHDGDGKFNEYNENPNKNKNGLYYIKKIPKINTKPLVSQNKNKTIETQNSKVPIDTSRSVAKREQETQTNTEVQTQTSESINYPTVQTQTDAFKNTFPLYQNQLYTPSQQNFNNRPLHKLENQFYASSGPPWFLVNNNNNNNNNIGKALIPIQRDQIPPGVKLIVRSPKTKYISKEELKVIRQQTNNSNLSFHDNYRKNERNVHDILKKESINNEGDQHTNISPKKGSSKLEKKLENIRKPVKFTNE